jgi:hypothetical protein
MRQRSSARRCNRENDLIAFLYGEVNEREGEEFERHLRTCSECESEFNAFKPIRESTIAWRNEALRLFSEIAPFEAQASVPRKQSAMTSFREFFNLSPLWLKGAVAFASIAFCVFGSLALMSLLNRGNGPLVSNEQKLYTQAELNKKIDEAVQLKVNELASQKASKPQTAIVDNGLKTASTVVGPNRRSALPASAKTLSRPLTRTEREQLAVDLRLISPKDEMTLDLIGDRINQEE